MGRACRTQRRVVGKLEGKSHYENLEVDVSITLKWILKEEDRGSRLDSSSSG
jgi:hypothetical protein